MQRRQRILCFSLGILAVTSAFALPPMMSGSRVMQPAVFEHEAPIPLSEARHHVRLPSLRLMTLNMAHGRGNDAYRVFQKGSEVEVNLDDIVTVLRREAPDIVALQEVDGPSIWSGMRDQVEYLAHKGGFPYSLRGEHVKGMKLSYGTALLSRIPLREPVSITFSPSPPTLSKGFVVATVTWPGDPAIEIDVISLHLDFSRNSVRQRQMEDIIDLLSSRNRVSIVMGDFNCEWQARDSALHMLAEQCSLKGYQTGQAAGMETFPLLGKRLDWVLISSDLEFTVYRVLEDPISDHRGVLCEIQTIEGMS
ncbi:MAG: endonuclease/exonuclease/phosphatase family protein [bacterium]